MCARQSMSRESSNSGKGWSLMKEDWPVLRILANEYPWTNYMKVTWSSDFSYASLSWDPWVGWPRCQLDIDWKGYPPSISTSGSHLSIWSCSKSWRLNQHILFENPEPHRFLYLDKRALQSASLGSKPSRSWRNWLVSDELCGLETTPAGISGIASFF